jgi:hypothetical protein
VSKAVAERPFVEIDNVDVRYGGVDGGGVDRTLALRGLPGGQAAGG